ncbi:DsbA family protein [Patescibacteria group bacterium]|nr:DsbA family protein [Patescibacteria group bacterium]
MKTAQNPVIIGKRKMKDFWARNKAFIIVVLATAVLLFGGILLFTRNGGGSNLSGNTINTSLLIPQNAIITSGFANGEYLPASTSAKVTLVEFGDYECPACSIYSPFVQKLLTDFAGKFNYGFRNYPLTQHKNAPISSYAVEAAGLQGKYWQMHEKVYATQSDWATLTDPATTFVGYAKDMGLDVNKFTSDLGSQAVKDKVQSDFNDGTTIGITETPSFYLNGQKIALSGSYDQLKNLIQDAISK